MEIIKKYNFKYVLVVLFVFMIGMNYAKANAYENYYGININNEEYNNLIGLGFSEDEIYYMDLQTFEENKDLPGELVAQDVTYYKTVQPYYGNSYTVELTEEEYNTESNIMTLGTVETQYKTMVTTLSKNGSKYRYKISLLWNNIPKVKSYDIIGIGFSDDVYINSSVNFYYYYCSSSSSCSTEYYYYNKKSTATGGTTVFKIPSSTSVSLSSVMYYDVSKDTTGTINSLEMCGDYAHATSSVPATNTSNHNISIGGIGFYNGLSGYYDTIPCAVSTWSGTW